MDHVKSNFKKFLVILTVIALSNFLITAAWATISTVMEPEGQIQELETYSQSGLITPTESDVEASEAANAKTRVPEPTTIAFFGSGLFGMIISFVRRTYLIAKRGFDIVASVAGIIVLSPLFLIVALAVKLTSKGPVLFQQTRVGRNGKSFEIFKFRTMRQDAEKFTGPVWASENDPRLTPIGKFLRKTHVDEIPQFFNVLMGDMSVIGPRPERPVFVQQFTEEITDYKKRLAVKPGITGMAQVWHSYDETIQDVKKKIKFDLLYIKKLCLWTDISILFRTVRVVFTGEGAR